MRDFGRTPEPSGRPGDGVERVRAAPVRRPAPPRAPAALRPAVRDGRRAGQLGGAARPDAGPEGSADGGARRGPPAGVRGLRGRDPVGRVRRRRRDRLGPRHVGAVQGRRPGGRGRGGRAARRAARVAGCAGSSCSCDAARRTGTARSSGCCCTSATSTPSRAGTPRTTRRSVLSGRTNDEVKADPDRLWRSDLPGRARRRSSCTATAGPDRRTSSPRSTTSAAGGHLGGVRPPAAAHQPRQGAVPRRARRGARSPSASSCATPHRSRRSRCRTCAGAR